MNLVMVSVLLLATLAIRPTLIYGSKGLASGSFGSSSHGNGKKHSPAAKSKASLVLQMESDDVYVRRARGAGGILSASAPTSELVAAAEKTDDSAANINSGDNRSANDGLTNISTNGNNNNNHNNNSNNHGGGKRGKNNSKKSNKNFMAANMPATSSHTQQLSLSLPGGKKAYDKKFSATAANLQQQQQPQHQHQHQHAGQGNNNNNNNHNGSNRGKQRQLLKSQQHQSNGKRAVGAAKSSTTTTTTNSDKSASSEKAQSTCRYTKSAWTECDAKTNSKSRTLTLKKGENNCLPTRTIEKKCKKVCRYEKGTWSECNNGQMTRHDKLKSTGNAGDSSNCQSERSIDKKCNPGGGSATGGGNKANRAANRERKNKDKASRRAQQQA